jgi:hypothetical protein
MFYMDGIGLGFVLKNFYTCWKDFRIVSFTILWNGDGSYEGRQCFGI